MIFKIHYNIGDYEDYFLIEGDSIEQIRELSDIEFEKRGLDIKENFLWSEELKNVKIL